MNDPGFPDIEIMQAFASLSFDSGGGTVRGLRLREDLVERLFKPLENTRAFFYLPMLLHPRSKGFMRLQSRNYLDHPIFEPNYFKDPRDLETLVAGMEEAIRLASQPAMRKLGLRIYTPQLPTCPHVQPGTHDYWRCWAQTISATFHHQVGTCKMGPEADATTVVDHTLRVHGFSNLRVADVGIIPQPPSGHTNAYALMIGEKASDMIKETWDETNAEDFDYYYGRGGGDESENYVDDYTHTSGNNNIGQLYPPKYFEFNRRRKRSVGFDWQKSSHEEMTEKATTVSPKVQVEMGKVEQPTARIELSLAGNPTKDDKVLVMTSDGVQSSPGDKLNDLRSVLRPSEVDIIHKSSVDGGGGQEIQQQQPKDVAPLIRVTAEHEESVLAVDEDKIKTVNLDNSTQFDKGKNKPKIVTDILSSAAVNATEFEAKSFPADNSTRAVHLPVLDGKLEHEEMKAR